VRQRGTLRITGWKEEQGAAKVGKEVASAGKVCDDGKGYDGGKESWHSGVVGSVQRIRDSILKGILLYVLKLWQIELKPK